MKLVHILGTVLVAGCGVARAQLLSDPTRPPGIPLSEGAAEASTAVPRLQSILISPMRKLAVINGQTVPLGGRIGDATLLAISETSVTLRRGAHLEILRLLPDVAKKPADTSAGRIIGKGEAR